jgi:hypothetical protein
VLLLIKLASRSQSGANLASPIWQYLAIWNRAQSDPIWRPENKPNLANLAKAFKGKRKPPTAIWHRIQSGTLLGRSFDKSLGKTKLQSVENADLAIWF